MNLKRGGLLFAGVVCSTFSIVNRGTSGRTLEDPLGRQLLDLFLGYINGNFRILKWRYCIPYKAIFDGDIPNIPLHRPYIW